MKDKISLIVGIILVICTAGAFYWLWGQTKNYTVNTIVAENLKPIEIETVKNEAKTLLSGLENKAGIPIPTPDAKMGKTNPFK